MEKLEKIVAVIISVFTIVIGIPIGYIESNGNVQFTAMLAIFYCVMDFVLICIAFFSEKA